MTTTTLFETFNIFNPINATILHLILLSLPVYPHRQLLSFIVTFFDNSNNNNNPAAYSSSTITNRDRLYTLLISLSKPPDQRRRQQCDNNDTANMINITNNISPLEEFTLRELIYRYISHHETLFVIFIIFVFVGPTSLSTFRKWNGWLCIESTMSVAILMGMMMMNDDDDDGDECFGIINQGRLLVIRIVIHRVLAIGGSFIACRHGRRRRRRVVMTKEEEEEDEGKMSEEGGRDACPTGMAMKSLPGRVILLGAAINLFVIITTLLQTISSSSSSSIINGTNSYYATTSTTDITPLVHTCFHLSLSQSLFDVMTHLVVRDLASRVQQLQAFCGYQVILHFLRPFFWCPEGSGFVRLDDDGAVVGIHGFRTFLILCYGVGFLLPGV